MIVAQYVFDVFVILALGWNHFIERPIRLEWEDYVRRSLAYQAMRAERLEARQDATLACLDIIERKLVNRSPFA